jgi:uncharacterized membrane protein YozB (DUF420 family)
MKITDLSTLNAKLNAISAVLLAAVMTPFILIAVWFALRERFDRHRRLVRWVWPVWIYVSISGVIIYLMLYHL